MPLPQILRSRVQFAVPLLRQSIRVNNAIIRPRCFANSIPRAQGDVETTATTGVTEEVTTTENSEVTSENFENSTQNGISEPATPATPPPAPAQSTDPSQPSRPLVRSPGFTVRRTNSTFLIPVELPRGLSFDGLRPVRIMDQGNLVVRLSKLFEGLRDPTIIPLGALMIQRFSSRPEGGRILIKKTIVVGIDTIIAERRFIQTPTPGLTQSPLMTKLGITSIEGDLSRYLVENLKQIGLRSLNSLDPEVPPGSNQFERFVHFNARRVAENIEIFLKTPVGENVVLEGRAGIFGVFEWMGALSNIISQTENLTVAMQRAAGIPHPNDIASKLPWDSPLYRNIMTKLRAVERQTAEILSSLPNRPEHGPEIEETDKALSAEIETVCFKMDKLIQSTRTIIDLCEGNRPQIHSVVFRSISSLNKRIVKNLAALTNTPRELDLVPVASMYGEKPGSRTDLVTTVHYQINRNLRSASLMLSEMGHPLPTSKIRFGFTGATPTSGERSTIFRSVNPGRGPTIRRGATISSAPTIRHGPTITRGFSTMAPRSYQERQERDWSQRPQSSGPMISRTPMTSRGPQISRGPRQDRAPGFARQDRGPGFSRQDRGPAFSRPLGKRLAKREEEAVVEKDIPLEDRVRAKMMEREKERAKAMKGLDYSLLSVDHQEGGSDSIERVVEKDLFQNVGGWEGGGEAGGLTDESGIEPLRKGDMCEIRTAGCSQLGVYLRPSLFGEPTSDFLLTNGEILMMPTPRVTFAIPAFVPKDTMARVIDYLDKVMKASKTNRHNLHQIVLPRKLISPVIDKVRSFASRAAELYAGKRVAFDNLYRKLAYDDEPTNITLFEVVEQVFGDKYGGEELYAAHQALIGDGMRYQTDKATHRATSEFTVRSKNDVKMIESVTDSVRESGVKKKKKDQGKKAQLASFIEKARTVVDLSRKFREEDLQAKKYNKPPVEMVEMEQVQWDKSDMLFIEFVKASVLQYGSQSTPMDGLVPTILRAMDRYTGELDGAVGYQFLTEIGAWGAWENVSLRQKNTTFPGYGTSKVADDDQVKFVEADTREAVEKMQLEDCMKGIRKDWGELEVYCIDDASAHEIDDGISLERISETESWVHVHIANPTAFLAQNHWLSDLAWRRRQSLYLPEKTYPMLPSALTNVLGMGPDRAVLSISTKVSNEGEILDVKVQAGFVRNVKRFTYDAISVALGKPDPPPVIYDIGEFPKREHKVKEPAFTTEQLANLKTLYEIALACRKRRKENNMVECGFGDYDVSVYDGLGSPIHPTGKPHPILYRGHPSIRLMVNDRRGTNLSHFLVSEIMQTANNATARFCGQNNIAVPFRVMEYDYDRSDLVKYFQNEILPQRNELGYLSYDIGLRYMFSVGLTRMDASPKPHRLLGFEHGYVRATSPLRRYSDMVAHWQIQSYLLGKTPRTAKQLQNIIPEIDRGERLANFTGKDSKRFWATVALGRILETDKSKFPVIQGFMVMEKARFPSPSVGFVVPLGMAGKVIFKTQAEETSVNVGDILKVTPNTAKAGDKFVWYDFQALEKKAPQIQ